MSNDFLDKYKQKSDKDMSDIAQVHDDAQGTAAGSEQGNENIDKVQNSTTSVQGAQGSAAQGGMVSGATGSTSTSGATMNFEQKSTFKQPTKRAPSKRPKEVNPIIKYIIAAAVLLVIVVIIIFFISRGKAVPAMVGKSINDAQLWANENKVIITQENIFSDEIPAGEIISQIPAEGESLKSDAFFQLTVSSGPDLDIFVPVPDIDNMTMTEVEQWAADNHMTAVRITTQDSETVPSGSVIEYRVNDNTVLGDEIKRDTPFYVVFSRGKGEGEAVTLPNFLTMSLDEAKTFAEENEIILDIVEVFSDTIAKGNIISQSIKAEEVVRTGDSVILNVSKGEEIIVPNFFAMTKDEAALEASRLGITTLVSEKYVMNYDEGKLSYQSMRAGTLYEDGDIVELVYSKGYKIVVQSFVGSSEPSVREWVTPLNEEGASIKINTTYTSSDSAPGTILAQDKIDYTMRIDDTLNIVVSSGKVIFMPDLVTPASSAYGDIMTREKVTDICKTLNIVPVFVEQSNSSKQPGEVWQQSIASGSEVKEGSTVTLLYNPVTSNILVPDFKADVSIDTKAEVMANIDINKKFIITFTDVPTTTPADDGKIKSQSLAAGSSVAFGTAITLEVYVHTP